MSREEINGRMRGAGVEYKEDRIAGRGAGVEERGVGWKDKEQGLRREEKD